MEFHNLVTKKKPHNKFAAVNMKIQKDIGDIMSKISVIF